jgi:hypothetical protein
MRAVLDSHGAHLLLIDERQVVTSAMRSSSVAPFDSPR